MTAVTRPYDSLTHYQCVRDFHEQFGHPKPDTIWESVFNDNPVLVNFRLDFIREEITELETGIKNLDPIEILDGLCDILYVVHGAAIAFGIDLDQYCLYNRSVLSPTLPKTKEFIRECGYVWQRFILIYHSLCQLKHHFEEQDMTGVTHTLVMLLTDTYGLGIFMGFDMDAAFRLVHVNNMTKLCDSEEAAIETVAHYKAKPEFGKINVSYRLAPDQIHWVVFNKDTGKVLKSKTWVKPDFSTVL